MNYKLLLFGFLSLGFARISAQTFPLQVKEEKLTYVTANCTGNVFLGNKSL